MNATKELRTLVDNEKIGGRTPTRGVIKGTRGPRITSGS